MTGKVLNHRERTGHRETQRVFSSTDYQQIRNGFPLCSSVFPVVKISGCSVVHFAQLLV
jgi:hypothetical protein